MQAKELDILIIHMGMELNLHKTLCHFLVAQLQVELNLEVLEILLLLDYRTFFFFLQNLQNKDRILTSTPSRVSLKN
jgi:hypothetical protein